MQFRFMNNDPGLYLTGGNLSTVNQISLSQPQNSAEHKSMCCQVVHI